jgi:hypothetical protein
MNQEHTGQGAEDKGFFPEKNILPPRLLLYQTTPNNT